MAERLASRVCYVLGMAALCCAPAMAGEWVQAGAADFAAGLVAEGLERGTLDDLLEVPPQEDLFRRLVR